MYHERDPKKGAILTGGEVAYQLTELVKADPFGVGGTINVGDKIATGSIDIRPVLGNANDKEDEELMTKILAGLEPQQTKPI